MSDAEWDERVRRMELRMNPETLDKMLNRPSGAGEAVASAVALSPGPAAPSPAELFAASDWSRLTYKAPLRKSILTERDAFELRYYRAKEVRWRIGMVIDALLAPAMLPAAGWTVRMVTERCTLDCEDDAEPAQPARLVAGHAVDVLMERLIAVTRGRWNRARWNDPDDTLWGLGL